MLDTGTGKVLTGRREPQLLLASAGLSDDGLPTTSLPDGNTTTGLGAATDAALSLGLGRPVSLVAAADVPPQPAEVFVDSPRRQQRDGRVDMPAGPVRRRVSAAPADDGQPADAARRSTPTAQWDVRRFRPNLLIDAEGTDWVEDAWSGHSMRIGEVGAAGHRAVQPLHDGHPPQPGLDKDLDVFRTLNREHGATFGLWATVTTPGTIRAGDEVSVDV